MSTLPPLSLYIHIPWCVRKCPYCDFNSHAVKGEIPEAAYVKALLSDLQYEQPAAQGREIETIFIGGGTPSLFTADAIAQILDGANRIIPFSRDIEITMEANPGTFEQERFAGYLKAGVNRLSIGVQSFNQSHLQALGRIHSGDDARKAISAARELGYPHLNIDLMHGLPGQNEEQALYDLETAIALGPDHLSWYQLTIEPNTEFYAKPPIIPMDETLWDIQQAGQALLAAAGFQQYEISAYAKGSQARARHNLNYWQFGDYIGIGAGAHGKVTFVQQDLILRRWKQRSPKAYLQSINPLGGEQAIAREDRPFEFMMNVLRLNEGVEEAVFAQRALMPLTDIQGSLAAARQRSLLEPTRLQATPQGQLFLNDLLETFIA
ncbi:radical SAM family heme chaperone HemW [Neptunomonas qingdaonensis]|uniref:Heme chaperone HemW n=1 Tax=Neptunomonas qingdaonensis TaxID=1045558 RepID=A0A1I2M1S9_9GAMM|nr:radical SAM family heme chaperone HemW [Neptunomonas qingdaonensis]SFF84820.1 oxygen-independent coproporphyrinogen-3 oxidase [Neptunomonas qingdaonensis]